MKAQLSATLLAIGLASTGVATAAAQYHITDLGAPAGTLSEGISINEQGDVVGFYSDGEAQHAYLYSNGSFTPLGSLGGARSVATAINNQGQIVGGAAVAGDLSYHAFLYESGGMHDLGTLGGVNSEAWSINDKGQITGWSKTSSSGASAFLYDNGEMKDLGTFGGNWSEARGINSSGVITGWLEQGDSPYRTQHAFILDGQTVTDPGTLGTYQRNEAWAINDLGMIVGSSMTTNSGLFHAFWFDGTSMIDLGDLGGGLISEAYSINNLNQIVGWSHVQPDEALHAFFYQDGVMTDLNDLVDPNSGWVLTQARDINDHGMIAATGSYLGGATRAVLLTPVPEPSTYAMMLAALGLVGIRLQSRKAAQS